MGTVLYQSKNRIAYVTLNRPQVYNAMDGELLRDLLGVIKRLEQSDDQIVIVHGSGAAFSSGGDVSVMGTEAMLNEMDAFLDLIHEITVRWFSLQKIVISAIHGSAAGLGLSFALNADVVVAEEAAKLGMLFAGVGFVPDGGGHYFLEDRMGSHQAKQFIWSMKQVDGKTAKQIGLVDEITDGHALDAATHLAKKMLQLPLDAIVATKEIYHTSKLDTLEEILKKEKSHQMELAKGENHREGVRAFLEKRHPKFK